MPTEMNIFAQSGFLKIASSLTIVLASFLLVGCEDVFYRPPDPPEELDFGIVLFDQAGTEGTSFRKGTDVQIGLKLTKDGGKFIQWNLYDECRLYSNQDFLLVFKSNESLDKPPTLYFPLGAPYQIPAFCRSTELTSDYITAGTVILVFPWSSNPANEPLVAGRYYTTATFDLIIDGKVESWDLRTDFEIYN
jgi:hypothetical protein